MTELRSKQKRIRIGPFSFKEFTKVVARFHGFPAPGVILGGIMVNAALKKMPSGILFNALSETTKCLPDSIQLLTPCTVGNGWLQVRNLGRFALALYDKETGQGIRLSLEPSRIEDFPEIKNWYYKLIPKEEADTKRLLASIHEGGSSLCRIQEIRILPEILLKVKRGKRIICPQCQEAYPDAGQAACPACQGESPYI